MYYLFILEITQLLQSLISVFAKRSYCFVFEKAICLILKPFNIFQKRKKLPEKFAYNDLNVLKDWINI